MWNNAATVANVKTLRERGCKVLDPEVGALTSGDVGQGRFPATSSILQSFAELFNGVQDLHGKRILVTAGGTREPIDPVRFIGNRSSGKQGYAIARSALARGADVTLICANVALAQLPGVKTINVETAAQMQQALNENFEDTDVLVMSAAVADARPVHQSSEKIKKDSFHEIELIQNPDLLASLAGRKRGQVIIAFAAETSLDIEGAKEKMKRKSADILYLNDVSGGDIFNSEMTHGKIFTSDGKIVEVAETTKDTLAHLLLTEALHKLG